jgi:hypothetical protein
MDRDKMIEAEIDKIKARNASVESDKAWENSSVRKTMIALITYIFVSLYMIFLGVNKPWLNAIVPTGGYVLSTMTITFAKKYWLRRRKK